MSETRLLRWSSGALGKLTGRHSGNAGTRITEARGVEDRWTSINGLPVPGEVPAQALTKAGIIVATFTFTRAQ